MIYTIVIVLIIVLVVIAIAVNAVQQHKEKQENERRAQVARHKAIIDETETILMNAANVPLSVKIIIILLNRILNALKDSYALQPEIQGLKQRIEETAARINNMNPDDASQDELTQLPDAEKQLIGLIQGIKKLRSVLRSEHSKGKIDTQQFMSEDKRLERMQLKINVETSIKRGVKARSTNMLGSARQYFEKAIITLEAQTNPDEYVHAKLQEVQSYLKEITAELKSTNARDVSKKQKDEEDDLDILFAPKKKW